MTSDVAVVTNKNYSTNGESAIVIKDIDVCDLFLDVKIRSMLLQDVINNLQERGIESKLDKEVTSISIPNNRESLKILNEIGFCARTKETSRV